MSNTKREPLLSDEFMENHADKWNEGVRGITIQHRTCLLQGADWAREHYEAARAKDAELIQQLVALCRAVVNGLDEMMRPANMECDGAYCTGCWKDINGQLVKLLFAAGFKPTE
jgi:hypothetical protein